MSDPFDYHQHGSDTLSEEQRGILRARIAGAHSYITDWVQSGYQGRKLRDVEENLALKEEFRDALCTALREIDRLKAQLSLTEWVSGGLAAGEQEMLERQVRMEAEIARLKAALAATENGLTIADYEEVLEDHRRLVRDIDEILNGKEGMARQASLCDLISPIKELKRAAPAPTTDPEYLAKRFHEIYEAKAPEFGYETRKESAKPWADVPAQNKALMTAVCAQILAEFAMQSAAPTTERPTQPGNYHFRHHSKADWMAVRIERAEAGFLVIKSFYGNWVSLDDYWSGEWLPIPEPPTTSSE